CVTTFDDWCVQFYERSIGRRLPWNASAKQPDYSAIRATVRRHLAGRKIFEAVMVDEGQDLPAEDISFLAGISGHVTVAMDRRQQIYEAGSGEPEILQALGIRKGDVALLEAFRCSEYVVRLACEFLPDPRERAAFLCQARASFTDLETPLLYLASDFEDEKLRLLEVLRERQLADRSVAILFPLKRQVEGFAQWLREEGFEVETRKSGLDFDSPRPKLLTIHSAKGLTFDSVLLPGLVEPSFPGSLQERRERLLYVAITRATRWIYLSAVEGGQIPELERLHRLAGTAAVPLTLAHAGPGEMRARKKALPTAPVAEDDLAIL
ncbi:MAG: ATP-binding domain-containing protein, partial [Bryobacteraceae bacterium]|nr:ATP-binding domain-containing protein [Bryobacteraceae bacterium]